MVDADTFYLGFGASVRELFILKRVMVLPFALEFFEAVTPDDPHAITCVKVRIVQSLCSSQFLIATLP